MKREEALEKIKLAKELVTEVRENYEEERLSESPSTSSPGVDGLAYAEKVLKNAVGDLSCKDLEELLLWSVAALGDLLKEGLSKEGDDDLSIE